MEFLDKIGLEHLWAQTVNRLNTKEDLDSKTTIISSSSTNDQYPGAKAVYDFVTANIPDTSTFAKTSDLTDGTITVELAKNAEEAAHAAWANGTNNADYATAAGKAGNDGNGNVIADTYATKAQLENEVNSIMNGTYTVDKAYCDSDGNGITLTYATKTQLSDGSVTKIGNVLTIGGETYDGSAAVNAGRRSWYGTCTATGNQPAKEVDIPDFVLETGAKISVRFTDANSASSPTLNVNNTGAKSIRNSLGAAGTLTYRWYPGQVVDFVYDGTYWLLQQPWIGSTAVYGVSKVESLTLNGKLNATPSFYAPTSAGTSGYLLKSNGSGFAPTWLNTPYIVKSYRGANSNSTWARKWSDGFIECGGLATGNTVNISFLNEYNFATTNYCVALCYQNSDSSAGINIINVSAYNKATTGFTIRNASSTSFKRTWMAFGY